MKMYCRLCLTTGNVMKVFNTSINNIPTAELIQQIFNLKISPGDSHSKFICEDCLRFMKKVQIIREFVQNNQNRLISKEAKPKQKSLGSNSSNRSTTDHKTIRLSVANYKLVFEDAKLLNYLGLQRCGDIEDGFVEVGRDELKRIEPKVKIVPLEKTNILDFYIKLNPTTYKKRQKRRKKEKVSPGYLKNLIRQRSKYFPRKELKISLRDISKEYKVYICELCHKMFMKKKLLKMHKLEKHKPRLALSKKSKFLRSGKSNTPKKKKQNHITKPKRVVNNLKDENTPLKKNKVGRPRKSEIVVQSILNTSGKRKSTRLEGEDLQSNKVKEKVIRKEEIVVSTGKRRKLSEVQALTERWIQRR